MNIPQGERELKFIFLKIGFSFLSFFFLWQAQGLKEKKVHSVDGKKCFFFSCRAHRKKTLVDQLS